MVVEEPLLWVVVPVSALWGTTTTGFGTFVVVVGWPSRRNNSVRVPVTVIYTHTSLFLSVGNNLQEMLRLGS